MTKNISNLNLKLTLNQMLLSNVHVGHTKKFLNSDIKPYLLGTRNNLYILNIAKTSFQFKLFINLLVNITSLRQKVLVVKERDVYNFRNLLNLKQLYYSDGKWIGGSLTNFRQVKQSQAFKEDNNYYNSLGSLRYMPSLVFFFDVNSSKWALVESSNLEIPVVSVVDSNTSLLSYINYPIIGNNKSFEALFLYLNLILNSVKKGHQKELLKILNII